jgi:large conductance mechanosensitive channel
MKMWEEFKAFAFKGNMIDLAVAVVIGGAFGNVINSVVKNVIMPVVTFLLPKDMGYETWQIWRIHIGAFLSDLISFLILAVAVFFVIVKIVGALMKKPAPPPPNTKDCPLCLMAIPIKATKCGHCTADLK